MNYNLLGSLQWIKLSNEPNMLPEHIIEQYWNKVRIFTICSRYNLSNSFIEKHADKLNWNALSGNHNLIWDERFLEKYLDKIQLRLIKQPLSEDFVLRNKSKISFQDLDINGFSENLIKECYSEIRPLINRIKISNEYLIQYFKDHIDWFHQFSINNYKIPEYELQKIFDTILNKNKYANSKFIRNQTNLTIEFIKNNIENINLKDIKENENMNQDLKNKILIFS